MFNIFRPTCFDGQIVITITKFQNWYRYTIFGSVLDITSSKSMLNVTRLSLSLSLNSLASGTFCSLTLHDALYLSFSLSLAFLLLLVFFVRSHCTSSKLNLLEIEVNAVKFKQVGFASECQRPYTDLLNLLTPSPRTVAPTPTPSLCCSLE